MLVRSTIELVDSENSGVAVEVLFHLLYIPIYQGVLLPPFTYIGLRIKKCKYCMRTNTRGTDNVVEADQYLYDNGEVMFTLFYSENLVRVLH